MITRSGAEPTCLQEINLGAIGAPHELPGRPDHVLVHHLDELGAIGAFEFIRFSMAGCQLNASIGVHPGDSYR